MIQGKMAAGECFVDRKRFARLVAEALAALPPVFQEKMTNLEVVIEAWPRREDLEEMDLEPGETLFGLYRGVPLTERGIEPPLIPDQIVIFQGPIESCCGDDEEIREEVRRTVLHEIAHHFGIGEGRLAELGWE
jgi:predicted Zn-dependent protease with MMP-like domain